MHEYHKAVADTYERSVTVDAYPEIDLAGVRGRVYLDGDKLHGYSLTAAQARRLARALKRAANVAEGKPAKPPKGPKFPRVIVDSDGDSWYRTDDGDEDRYTLGNTPDNGWRAPARWASDQTSAHVRAQYGIAEERP